MTWQIHETRYNIIDKSKKKEEDNKRRKIIYTFILWLGEAGDNNQFLKYAPTDANGNKIVANALTQEDLDTVVQGVLDRCDAKDGLKDGIINSWEKCDFKPEMVEKKIGKEKVDLLNAIFNGAKNSKGENMFMHHGLMMQE